MSIASRQLGASGPAVCPLSLGTAIMVSAEGDKAAASLATLNEAMDRGITLIDTADFYGAGVSEMLVGKAIAGRRDDVVLSVKFGGLRSPDGAFLGIDNRPAAIKNFVTYSLKRLGVDHIDIYRPARLDPKVPIEESIGAIAELVQAGYVRHIGLSEVGAETIRRAHAVHPICDLQIEYSLMSRGPEAHLFPALRALGIAVTAYGVLAHGLLSGTARPAAAGDQRAHLPWFRADNFARNQQLVHALSEIAMEKGVTNSQLAIAWVLARSPDIVPVIGARTTEQLAESVAALDVALSADDMARIEEAVPSAAVAGTRYDERLMQMLDSEKPPA